ncbi:ADIPOR-like receptor, partial [Stegodyphus mimosarum]
MNFGCKSTRVLLFHDRKDMDLSDIFGPNTLCRERQFTSDPGNLDLPAPHIFLDDTSIGDAHFDLPCSPGDHVFNESELSADDDDLNIDIVDMSLPARAAEQAEHLVRKVLEEAEQAEHLVRKVWEEAWKVCHFSSLPKWLQDNDFLHRGHRPPLPSFTACFRSIFRIHTETGNIWTHLLGCISFIGIAFYFLTR